MAGRIANVWGVACPKCHSETNRPCRDMRNVCRELYGRRTHRERARLLREQGRDGRETKYDEMIRRTRSKFIRTGGGTFDWNLPVNFVQNEWVTANVITTNTGTWATNAYTTGGTYVTRDEIWNGWTVGNTTTGTYTYLRDEDMARFEGTGITWDVGWHQMGDALTHAGEAARHVAEQWRVIQQRTVPTAEQLQAIADREQRAREERARRALEQEQRYQAAQEARIMAEARGGELLQMLLTPEQKEFLRRDHTIPVRGSQGGLYEIDTLMNGVHGNIVQVDEHGCRLGRICVAPRMRENDGQVLPLADGWVGQLLAIMSDEETFRTTGNWSSRQVCRHPDVPILERAA